MMKVYMLVLVVLSMDPVWGMALQNQIAVGSPFSDDLLDPQVPIHEALPKIRRSIVCPTPDVIENGYIEYDGELEVTSIVKYECRECYDLDGPISRICQVDGTWTLHDPTCNLKYCDPIPDFFENGKIIGNDNSCGSMIEYECNPGYKLIGKRTATCRENKKWSHRHPPTCEVMDYNSLKDKPTLHRFEPFDPSGDVAVLLKATKGTGTDEEAIIGLLTKRTSDQRHKILKTYNTVYYNRDCINDLQSDLSGNFENAVIALMTPLPQYLAQELHRAIHGPGTKEITLVQILYSLNNQQLIAVKNAYYKEYEKHLVDDIKGETSGDFQKLLISMCDGKQDEKDVYSALANSIAHTLHTAGGNRSRTDESEFRRIMTSYSYPLLKMVFEEYKKIGGNHFTDAIDSELSGDLKKGVKAIYDIVVNRPAFFAKELHDCMSESGTRDATLIRLVLVRSEIDMQNIKEEYLKLYKKTLADKIKEVTSGHYATVLLALVEGNF